MRVDLCGSRVVLASSFREYVAGDEMCSMLRCQLLKDAVSIIVNGHLIRSE